MSWSYKNDQKLGFWEGHDLRENMLGWPKLELHLSSIQNFPNSLWRLPIDFSVYELSTRFKVEVGLWPSSVKQKLSFCQTKWKSFKWKILGICAAKSHIFYFHNIFWWIFFRILQGIPKNAPIKQTNMAKHSRLVNLPKWSKGVQKGSKMINLDVFDKLGLFRANLDTFRPFRTKINLLS